MNTASTILAFLQPSGQDGRDARGGYGGFTTQATPSCAMPTRHDELFDEIYRQHQGLLVKIVHAFAVERPDREDLFQEMLLAVWQALPRFKAEAGLPTYVYRVAFSCALNWKRSRQRYRAKIDCFAQELPNLTEPADPQTAARLRWLYAKIHALPPIDRTLMLLHLDELNYDEITAVTGMSKSNIGVRLHRIKQQLIANTEDIQNEI